uniref:Radical SAM protein n=1 Tax=Heterorhabditis bacteriophora TaxID=37862 RepID=A0A1I7W8L7_HETBA
MDVINYEYLYGFPAYWYSSLEAKKEIVPYANDMRQTASERLNRLLRECRDQAMSVFSCTYCAPLPGVAVWRSIEE